MNFEYYLTASIEIENGEAKLSNFSIESLKSIEDAFDKGDVIIDHVVLTADNKEKFIEIVKTCGIGVKYKSLIIEPSWVIENDWSAFVEEGCEKFGLNLEQIQML